MSHIIKIHYFKAKKNGEAAKLYKYTLNPSIVLNHMETTTMYAASDFSVTN